MRRRERGNAMNVWIKMSGAAGAMAIAAGACALMTLAGCSTAQNGANASNSQSNPDGGGSNGGGGGNNGAGADAGPDADPFAACTGVSIAQSGTWDVDLTAARVSGRVTLNGAAPSAANGATGQVSFRDPKTNAVATAAIDSTGTYRTTLAHGTYDVWYQADGQGCSDASPWPCVSHVLKSSVAISADGVLDVDVATVKASGNVTLGGKAFPASSALGTLGFADATSAQNGAGGAAGPGGTTPSGFVAIDTTGSSASYAATLVPGHYAISYAPASTACDGTTPCTGGVVRADVNVSASGALDIDVPVVVVRGHATLNGAALPAQVSLGSVFFSQGAGASAAVPLDSNGTYAAALFPGTYDVGYAGDQNATDTSLLPRNSGVLSPQVDLSHDGSVDLDIQSASIQGKVTSNGAAIAQGDAPGNIGFKLAGAATSSALATFAINAGTYRAVLLAGSYDVSYEGDAYACQSGSTPSMPCNRGKLKSVTLSKGQSGALDLDVQHVMIHGKITVNGASLGMNDVPTITFAQSGAAPGDSGATSFQVDAKNEYTLSLVPGTYDVGVAAGNCQDMTSTLPCTGGVIKQGVTLTSAGALDLDVPAITVNGRVTLAGQDVPQANDSRGSVFFSQKSGGTAETQPFASSGPISYSLRILPGNYVLGYQGNSQLCLDGVSPLPCHAVVVAGCP
jgi:hypothetical protein